MQWAGSAAALQRRPEYMRATNHGTSIRALALGSPNLKGSGIWEPWKREWNLLRAKTLVAAMTLRGQFLVRVRG